MKRFVLACALLTCVAGCDFITKAQGVMELAQEVGQNLEKDLKAPLTNDKIDAVLKVTPELTEFTKNAKEKWQPDPQGQNVADLAASLGALSEYLAFFKARDTRITEYYVDLCKICDAYWQVTYSEANEKAREQLEAKKKELEADTAMPAEAKETALKQVAIAIEQLEKAKLQKPEAKPDQPKSGQNAAYTLTDEEIALVTARLGEIGTAFKEAGYIKDKDAGEAAAVEAPTADPNSPGK